MRDRHPETERTELAGRSVRSRGRASGGGLVSHISRRSTRTAPSHCWIDLLEIKAPAPPAQRPCGRRCRAVLAPPTAGRGSGTKGLPPPGAPETEQPRRPAVGRWPSSQPSRSLRTDARWPRTCPARGDERPLGRLFGHTSQGPFRGEYDHAQPAPASPPRQSARGPPRTTLGPHANEKRRQTPRSTERQNRRSAAVFRQAERGTNPRLLDVVVELELAPHRW